MSPLSEMSRVVSDSMVPARGWPEGHQPTLASLSPRPPVVPLHQSAVVAIWVKLSVAAS